MRLLVLTGAGVSAESGLGTFRDKGGVWTRYDLNEVATPEGFARDPDKVHEFYNARRANAAGARPNAAHAALAELQDKLGTSMVLVTQNVDALHEAAGHDPVWHMHGALAGALCAVCDHRWPAPSVMTVADPCPNCAAPATRPDVVWFGETPYHMQAIYAAFEGLTHFAAIGTSGTVYPAAGFVELAQAAGAETFELNLEPSGAPFDRVVAGPAGQVVPEWAAMMAGLAS
jgi:NAD-dependent deacetylase